MELFSHFRLQYFFLALGLLVLGIFIGSWGAAIIAGGLAYLHRPQTMPGGKPNDQPPSDQGLNLVWANLAGRTEALDALAKQVEDTKADLIALTELPSHASDDLAALFPDHPVRTETGGRTPHDLTLLSRLPLEDVDVVKTDFGHPVLTADCHLGAVQDLPGLRIIALHPPAPLFPGKLVARDEAISVAMDAAAASPFPALLVGDLNTTPSAPGFAPALESGRLTDGAAQAPAFATWLSRNPLLGLRIDHVLVTDGITVSSIHAGPSIGSDHFPVYATLMVA
ncbi:MAG: endonuclease/exonuclease/phosphatase family protein [Pseudomonadota bacterium]